MAAPFLAPNPHHIQPSRENTRRGHDLLDNALAFRMPGAFAGRPRRSSPPRRRPGDTDNGAAGNGDGNGRGGGGGALRTIDGNSPPRSISPSSPSSRGRGRASGGGGSGGNKRGRAAQRGGRLGAVKLEVTPPKESRSGCDSGLNGSDLPPSIIAVEPSAAAAVAVRRACSVTPSPPASPQQEGSAGCGVGSGFLRRMSLSASPPPRRGLAGAFARVLPFDGGGGGAGGTGGEDRDQCSPCRAVANPRQAAAVAAGPAGTTAPRRRSAAVTEGSRIDLRGLDRAKGGNQPRAYRCRDSSVVVLGRERMLSVLPDDRDSTSGTSSSCGVVTWVLRYTELESCCINVSAGKELERSVGDVVVEVTTRRGRRVHFRAFLFIPFFCRQTSGN